MRTFLHRLLGFARTRGFDAAGGGRRWEGARTVEGLNAAILAVNRRAKLTPYRLPKLTPLATSRSGPEPTELITEWRRVRP